MSAGRYAGAWALAGAAVLALTLTLTAAAISSSDRTSEDGDPHVVTRGELRSALARSGLALRFVPAKAATEPDSIHGFARRDEARLGFEFHLFPSSAKTSIRSLARLTLDDFGLAGVRPRLAAYPMVRGVLGNVAYATYSLDLEDNPGNRSDRYYLRVERDWLRIGRALDDALFGLFPANDPFVHALSPDP